jgi:hypothetical protein
LSTSIDQSRPLFATSMMSSMLPRKYALPCFTFTLQPFSEAMATGVGFATLGTANSMPRDAVRI